MEQQPCQQQQVVQQEQQGIAEKQSQQSGYTKQQVDNDSFAKGAKVIVQNLPFNLAVGWIDSGCLCCQLRPQLRTVTVKSTFITLLPGCEQLLPGDLQCGRSDAVLQ